MAHLGLNFQVSSVEPIATSMRVKTQGMGIRKKQKIAGVWMCIPPQLSKLLFHNKVVLSIPMFYDVYLSWNGWPFQWCHPTAPTQLRGTVMLIATPVGTRGLPEDCDVVHPGGPRKNPIHLNVHVQTGRGSNPRSPNTHQLRDWGVENCTSWCF